MPRFKKGQVGYWKGKKRYYKNPEERARKISKNAKLNPNFGMKGKKATEEHKKHLRESHKHHKASNIAYLRILNEVPELEKQGFRCIPIGKVIPDIIAIKDNKVYAIEIERNTLSPSGEWVGQVEELREFWNSFQTSTKAMITSAPIIRSY